jgi:hypothetical protein
MEFCKTCDNLLTLTKDKNDSNSLFYLCKACNSKTECPTNFNSCLLKKNYGGNEKVFYELFVNQYTKYDPTLPRLNNTTCQNPDCPTNDDKSGKESEIVYIRYSEDKMKYIYLCCVCDTAWIHPEYEKVCYIKDGTCGEIIEKK